MPIPQADNNPAVTLEWRLKSNGTTNLGGWAIDDVRVFSFQTLPPPAVQYVLSPPQVNLGGTSNVSIQGTPSSVIAVLLSDNPGPTSLPGVPTLAVGSNFAAIPAVLDGTGNLAFSFQAPLAAGAVGVLTYSQVLELTGGRALTTSNKMVILFAQ
jgi:hypothetical protein